MADLMYRRRPVMFARPRLGSGSHHITVLIFSRCTVEPVTPMAYRSTSVPRCRHRLLSHAPHTMLRIVFVAVDRAKA